VRLPLQCTLFLADAIYTSEKWGNDESGTGSKDKPFKTVLRAMKHAGKEPFPPIFCDSKEKDNVSVILRI